MANDPFAFIGSNANYQSQDEKYNIPTNNAHSTPMNYSNYPSTHQNPYHAPPVTARPMNYSHPSENSIKNNTPRNIAPQRRHSVATFGPGGMLITCFPFVANRFEIVNGKSVPRSLNLSRIRISKLQVNLKVNDLFNGPLISGFSRKKAAVLELLVRFSILK